MGWRGAQVSAYGDNGMSDTGDFWTVVPYSKSSKHWERDADVELRCAARPTLSTLPLQLRRRPSPLPHNPRAAVAPSAGAGSASGPIVLMLRCFWLPVVILGLLGEVAKGRLGVPVVGCLTAAC